jgi:hypothetical protein
MRKLNATRQGPGSCAQARASRGYWRGKAEAIRRLPKLAEIYNCFSEGFDTADLKEAKALTDELSPWSRW